MAPTPVRQLAGAVDHGARRVGLAEPVIEEGDGLRQAFSVDEPLRNTVLRLLMTGEALAVVRPTRVAGGEGRGIPGEVRWRDTHFVGGDMGWRDYVHLHYGSDFAKFRSQLGGTSTLVEICDANPAHLRGAIEAAGLDHSARFVIELFLEASLAAGVHCYDRANYAAYVKVVKHAVFVEAHGWSGVHRPQMVLSAIPSWGAAEIGLLASACEELLPEWGRAYDTLAGVGRGRHVLRSLASDVDMAGNPYRLLPDNLVPVYLRGFREAAEPEGQA